MFYSYYDHFDYYCCWDPTPMFVVQACRWWWIPLWSQCCLCSTSHSLSSSWSPSTQSWVWNSLSARCTRPAITQAQVCSTKTFLNVYRNPKNIVTQQGCRCTASTYPDFFPMSLQILLQRWRTRRLLRVHRQETDADVPSTVQNVELAGQAQTMASPTLTTSASPCSLSTSALRLKGGLTSSTG
jgi:hypothetical protein